MSYKFDAIKKAKTLSQEVQNHIEKAILEKKFLPGDKLPSEYELCEMFGVSRTALREALQMLSAKGLITIKKRKGIFIEDYSPQNVIKPMRTYLELNFDKEIIRHILEVRKVLEPEICRLAARNRTELELEELKENLTEFEQLSPDQYQLEGTLDREFHRLIAQASHNLIIPIIMDPIYQILPKIKSLILSEINTAIDSAREYHRLIFNAIKDQDEEKAFDIMKKHMEIAEQHSQEIIMKMK